jgi:hypothetical protein
VSEVIAQVGPILLSSLLFATFDKVALLLPSAEETPGRLWPLSRMHLPQRRRKKKLKRYKVQQVKRRK